MDRTGNRNASGEFSLTMPRIHHVLSAAAAVLLAAASSSPASAETLNVEVQSSSVERDKTTNEIVVTIELAPDGKTAFENFTERHKGRQIEVRIGSTLLLKARLVEKISGGIIRANTKFNEDEGKKVAAQLTRGTMITLEDKLD
jgi:preprotein translocase subunit SecD